MFDFVWTEFIIRPMLNTLMVLYVISFQQMGIAIILFTILVRFVTLPLTIKQVRQMRAMSSLQPRLQEIQSRHAKDRGRISQETMKLYREAGVSPIGCLGPLVVQMPILIGLFRVLVQTLNRKTRRSGGPLGEALFLDTGVPHIFGRSIGPQILVAGPGRDGSNQFDHPGAGFRLHLAPAKNDHGPRHRRQTAGQPGDDAMDDASVDRGVFL